MIRTTMNKSTKLNEYHNKTKKIKQYSDTYRSASFVGLFVEFIEQEEEHNGMHANPPHKGFRIIAIDEQQLEGMDHNQNELNLKRTKTISKIYHISKSNPIQTHHLEGGQILLPPQIFLELWTHG